MNTLDPIEAICKEMIARAGGNRNSEEWAARLRAWWSPQRKAFYEAAIAEAQAWAHARPSDQSDAKLQATYRALCESDKKP